MNQEVLLIKFRELKLRDLTFFSLLLVLINISPVNANINQEFNKRSFSEQSIEEFKENSDFDYELTPQKSESLLIKIRRWLMDWLFDIFGNENGFFFFRLISWGLLIIIVFLTLYLLLGRSGTSLFYNAKEQNVQGRFEAENIHEIDFQQTISDALKQKNYRLAVRYQFLWTLKVLSDQQMIDWQPWKTSLDYEYEIKSAKTRNAFSQLANTFQYVWYGGFEADQRLYERMNSGFKTIKVSARENEG